MQLMFILQYNFILKVYYIAIISFKVFSDKLLCPKVLWFYEKGKKNVNLLLPLLVAFVF